MPSVTVANGLVGRQRRQSTFTNRPPLPVGLPRRPNIGFRALTSNQMAFVLISLG
jgi:hypothetical protein